jgi:hypothetical protein
MKKPVPRFYWDLHGHYIVVFGLRGKDDVTELGRFSAVGEEYSRAIKAAEELIADFKAGRKTPEW